MKRPASLCSLLLLAVPLVASCKRLPTDGSEPAATVSVQAPTSSNLNKSSHLFFNRVALQVAIPPHWNLVPNSTWMVYRPEAGGALVAFAAESDCSLLERKLYASLSELGLTNVAWDGSPKPMQINGMRATVAEGTALENGQTTHLKYALTYAPAGSGCLAALYDIWKSKSGLYRAEADSIIMSVERKH